MIRWSFFFEEGSVQSSVTEQAEDERIASEVEGDSPSWISLPGTNCNMYVNLSKVKAVAREIVNEEEKVTEKVEAQCDSLPIEATAVPAI